MQLPTELLTKLKESVSFFSSFSTSELIDLLKLAVSKTFQDGEVIFKEKTRGEKMYIILKGTVRISKYLGNKQEEVLVRLKSGACFGEMGVIDQSLRSATAIVEGGAAVMLVITEHTLSESNMLLAYKLYKNFALMLAGRLRETNNKLQEATMSSQDFKAQMKELLKKRMEHGKTLKGANLKMADLSQAFLNNADLAGAVLVGAKLNGTKCKQANFSGSKLINADITSVDFENANFQNADFTAASFQNVSFNGCNMSGAEFKGNDLDKTQVETTAHSEKEQSSDERS